MYILVYYNKLLLLLCYLRVPFQLASPPGFRVAHIPKGNLVYIYVIVHRSGACLGTLAWDLDFWNVEVFCSILSFLV